MWEDESRLLDADVNEKVGSSNSVDRSLTVQSVGEFSRPPKRKLIKGSGRGEGISIRVRERLYEDNCDSVGGKVKNEGVVLSTLTEKLGRKPNINCRIEAFGRMCHNLDCTRVKWVKEMGFGGLLNLTFKQLLRNLCYWLMTRVDPINGVLMTRDGVKYKLSSNQVRWVLGIPKGGKAVPVESTGKEMDQTISWLFQNYGKASDVEGNKRGIHITSKMMSRAEGEWQDEEVQEFKMLFLLLAVDMVLCPTQCPRLGDDLVATVCCAKNCREYDWCGLVLEKLMYYVEVFGKRFYPDGYAGGCGGCTIFLAIFYLDRLKRTPNGWGVIPRIKVWSMQEIRGACNDDRHPARGDFGLLGCVDVAYGETHPCEVRARDVEAPSECDDDEDGGGQSGGEVLNIPKLVRRGLAVKHNR